MAVETEAKMKVPSHMATREKLRQLGATPAGEHREINTFFDTHDRSLVSADKGLRLRVNRNITSGHSEAIVTFKGPRLGGKFKSREETEFTVDSPENVAAMLTMLEFEQVLSFEKKRESWKLEGCKVELDEVPHLGTFVEVEGPGDAQVTTVREKLGLGSAPIVTASYAAMLTTHLQEHGMSDRVVVFPNTTDPKTVK